MARARNLAFVALLIIGLAAAAAEGGEGGDAGPAAAAAEGGGGGRGWGIVESLPDASPWRAALERYRGLFAGARGNSSAPAAARGNSSDPAAAAPLRPARVTLLRRRGGACGGLPCPAGGRRRLAAAFAWPPPTCAVGAAEATEPGSVNDTLAFPFRAIGELTHASPPQGCTGALRPPRRSPDRRASQLLGTLLNQDLMRPSARAPAIAARSALRRAAAAL